MERPDLDAADSIVGINWLENINKAVVQRTLSLPPAFRCISCRQLVMDDGLSSGRSYDPAVALVKFHCCLNDFRCMLSNLLEVSSDEEHMLLLSCPISQLVGLLHQKKEQTIGTIKKEDNPIFLKACDDIVGFINLWKASDQDRATFVQTMQLLLFLTKFFGQEEEPLSRLWSNAFCSTSDAGWHLRRQ